MIAAPACANQAGKFRNPNPVLATRAIRLQEADSGSSASWHQSERSFAEEVIWQKPQTVHS
jgi:hypothetical protein